MLVYAQFVIDGDKETKKRLHQSKNTNALVSMLSRGFGSGGVKGSSNAEWSENRAVPAFIVS